MKSEVKTCGKCHQTKPRSEFHFKNRSRGYLHAACKTCEALRERPDRPAPKPLKPKTPPQLRATYRCMMARCTRVDHDQYPNYGGRGIRVCVEWSENCRVFYQFALANGWSPGLEIDRIDGDGHYEPGNIRFVTRTMNERQKGKTRRPTTSRFKGVSWNTKHRRWQAKLKVGGQTKFLGCFTDEESAARAYNSEASKHDGFKLNPV